MPTTEPQRRWMQFSLRTLFVGITLFAMWLGWETKLIRERKSAYQELSEHGMNPPLDLLSSAAGIPFWKRWLGDRSYGSLRLFVDRDIGDVRDDSRLTGEEARVRQLFPEATFYLVGKYLSSDGKHYDAMSKLEPASR